MNTFLNMYEATQEILHLLALRDSCFIYQVLLKLILLRNKYKMWICILLKMTHDIRNLNSYIHTLL